MPENFHKVYGSKGACSKGVGSLVFHYHQKTALLFSFQLGKRHGFLSVGKSDQSCMFFLYSAKVICCFGAKAPEKFYP